MLDKIFIYFLAAVFLASGLLLSYEYVVYDALGHTIGYNIIPIWTSPILLYDPEYVQLAALMGVGALVLLFVGKRFWSGSFGVLLWCVGSLLATFLHHPFAYNVMMLALMFASFRLIPLAFHFLRELEAEKSTESQAV